jgi:hypothetical protein
MAAALATLREQYVAKQRDVRRLEGLSLTRLLVSLRAERDDALARERAQAAAAQYRVAEAETRLDAAREELRAAWARHKQLTTAPEEYAQALDAKERHLLGTTDPRARRLRMLAQEHGRLTAERRELDEAEQAAQAAWNALGAAEDAMGSASRWSTYDTFFGGGIFSSAVKHSYLDEAAEAASEADRCLALLRIKLADAPGMQLTAAHIAVHGLTRFVDIWLDNVLTDLAIRDRIAQTRRNVTDAQEMVRRIRDRLEQRTAKTQADIDAIAAERRDILTR